jgi:NLI interacting factor-like phosphatase
MVSKNIKTALHGASPVPTRLNGLRHPTNVFTYYYGDDDQRPLVFLDLDSTLISALTIKDDYLLGPILAYPGYKVIEPYYVFPRPGLQYFLNKMFESYRVAVWTHATENYARHVIKEFIMRPSRSRLLETFMHYNHTEYILNMNRGMKDLTSIPEVLYQDNPTMVDAYIVDDNTNVWATNASRCVLIKPFDATTVPYDPNDDSLEKVLHRLDTTVLLGHPLVASDEPL